VPAGRSRSQRCRMDRSRRGSSAGYFSEASSANRAYAYASLRLTRGFVFKMWLRMPRAVGAARYRSYAPIELLDLRSTLAMATEASRFCASSRRQGVVAQHDDGQ